MNHRDYLKHLDNYIFQNNSENKTGMDGKASDLYRSMVNSHYINSLQKMFPRLNEVMDIPWEKWSSEYKTKYGNTAWELNSITKEFPQFLDENNYLPDYLIELCEYELAEFFVFTKLSEDKAIINETIDILYFEYDIANYVISLEKGITDHKPQKVQNVLGICRDPDTMLCIFSSLNLIDLDIIETLQFGDTKKTTLIDNLLKKYEIMGATKSLILDRIKYLEHQKILKEFL